MIDRNRLEIAKKKKKEKKQNRHWKESRMTPGQLAAKINHDTEEITNAEKNRRKSSRKYRRMLKAEWADVYDRKDFKKETEEILEEFDNDDSVND